MRRTDFINDPRQSGYVPSRCPVCSMPPVAKIIYDKGSMSGGEYYTAAVCSGCGMMCDTSITLSWDSSSCDEREKRWGPWERLVSRFPALMRLHKGDIFKWDDNYLARVLGRCFHSGDINLIFVICGYSPDSPEHRSGKVFGERDMEYGCCHEITDAAEIELFPWDLDLSECKTVEIPMSAMSFDFPDWLKDS